MSIRQSGHRRSKRIKTRKKNTSRFKIQIAGKLYVYFFIFLAAILFVGAYQVYDIKYVSGQEYETQAIYNQVNKIQDKIINPNRGAILDRNKQKLAVSSTVYTVVLDIRSLVKFEETKKGIVDKTLSQLNSILGLSMDDFKKYVEVDKTGKLVNDTNYKIIARKVPYKTGQKIKDEDVSCVYLEEDTERSYPYNSFAANLIGFIRGDSSYGLESKYNEYMVGVEGRIFRTYEEDNNIVTRQEPAKEGDSLVTTIDHTIQQFAEKAVKKAYYEFEAQNTSIIVMNPNTGEVIAMAEYPTFDLNNPNNISLLEDEAFKKDWDNMSDEDKLTKTLETWKCFNISDTFEPGSIFKPLVVGAAIEEGVINENTGFYCGGKRQVADREIPCHKLAGHGNQNAEQVIANSCNMGMIDIVNRLGKEKFYKYQRDLGFGEKTGIDITGESGDTHKLIYKLDQLNPVELATSSFGQGFNCTAIQAITAFSAAINGGNLMRPYVVSQIVDKDGNIVKENNPEIVRKIFTQETSDYLRNAMKSVVSDSGTGKKGIIKGYSIGGKTGTAQQEKRDKDIYAVSYIAYFPAEEPQYIAMSVINRPKTYADGVTTSVPMLTEVIKEIITYKSIPPSYETDDSDNGSKSESTEVVVSDYTNKNLKETIQSLNNAGLDFQLVGGSGDIVTKQFPSGESKVRRGTKVLLYIAESKDAKDLAFVPDVVDMDLEQAKSVIEELGFVCVVEDTRQNSENEIDDITEKTTKSTGESENNEDNEDNKDNKNSGVKVIAQVPEADIQIEKGTVIKLKI